MGGALANFAGLLHMVMHSLTKSAIFFAVGSVAQIKGGQSIAEIRGLTQSHPALGWGLALAVLSIAGMPPSGVFMSEFLVVTSSFARMPLLTLVLVLGLLLAFGALLLRLTGFLFGDPGERNEPMHGSLVPLYLHIGLVILVGLHMPQAMVTWFRSVAALLG
jgi:hydrogenase-4 component F